MKNNNLKLKIIIIFIICLSIANMYAYCVDNNYISTIKNIIKEIKNNQIDNAKEQLKNIILKNKKDLQAYSLLGYTYYLSGDYENAKNQYLNIQKNYFLNPYDSYILGIIYIKEKDYVNAKNLLKYAFSIGYKDNETKFDSNLYYESKKPIQGKQSLAVDKLIFNTIYHNKNLSSSEKSDFFKAMDYTGMEDEIKKRNSIIKISIIILILIIVLLIINKIIRKIKIINREKKLKEQKEIKEHIEEISLHKIEDEVTRRIEEKILNLEEKAEDIKEHSKIPEKEDVLTQTKEKEIKKEEKPSKKPKKEDLSDIISEIKYEKAEKPKQKDELKKEEESLKSTVVSEKEPDAKTKKKDESVQESGKEAIFDDQKKDTFVETDKNLEYKLHFTEKYRDFSYIELLLESKKLLNDNINEVTTFYKSDIFEEILELEIASSGIKKYSLALGIFEIKGLKEITDKIEEKDKKEIIKNVYNELRMFIRKGLDIPFTAEEDSFIIIFNETDHERLKMVIDKINKCFSKFIIKEKKIGIKYGFAIYPEDSTYPMKLYEIAVINFKSFKQ